MYTRFRLAPKSMTWNDFGARFKVTDSLNAAKMAKCSLVMTPCRVAGCSISVRRTYSCTRAVTQLLAQLVLCVQNRQYTETVEDKAKVRPTINGLYKAVHWLSISAKMYDLE